MLKRVILLVLAVGYLSILFETKSTEALKCYHCIVPNQGTPCPNEGRGELITCTDKRHVACYKLVANTRETGSPMSTPPEIGESRRKGCGILGAWSSNFNESMHPGCQPHNEYRDYCSCDTDRCNDEGKMTEYLTGS